MCPPLYYSIDWEDPTKNPWMNKKNQPNFGRAFEQWAKLVELYRFLGLEIYMLEPQRGLGDQVFTANIAWGMNNVFVMANFSPEARKPETKFAAKWFAENRFSTYFLPENLLFEGQGDIITTKEAYLYCWGVRNSLESIDEIARVFNIKKPIIPLKLIDPHFYHGDVCIRYSKRRNAILFYPGAFDAESIKSIERLTAKKKEVSREFMVQEVGGNERNFPLNGSYIGNVETFPWNDDLDDFPRDLRAWIERDGGEVVTLDFSQFGLSGAGHRCVTLFLD
jgi:N-dimethylarginine dimethylaminohydrolase